MKRHNALSFHRVHEAAASKMVRIYHIPGEFNPADILSMHWGYQQIWSILQPLLFYQGDTGDLLSDLFFGTYLLMFTYIYLNGIRLQADG